MNKNKLITLLACICLILPIILSIIFYSIFKFSVNMGSESKNIVLYGSIIFCIFSFIIVSSLGIIFLTLFNKTFGKTNNLLYNISQGDLTQKVNLNKESLFNNLYTNLNNLIVKFRALVAQVMTITDKTINFTNDLNKDAENIKISSKETTNVINEISKRMEEQTTLIKDVKSYSVEVISSAQNIANKSESIKKMAHTSQETINNSYKNFEVLIDKMNDSANSSIDTMNKIKNLQNKTSTIQNIVDQVSKISEGTNLLALNASIEAARAGEYGKGFAVVAEEVRTLSESSSDQAKQIQAIVDGIKDEITDISSKMEYETKCINEYIDFSKTTREYLNKINQDTQGTFSAFMDIDIEIEDQLNKVNKIGNIIENTHETFESIAASTEEVVAVSEEQYSITENTANRLEKLLDMNKDIEKYIFSFIKNYKIDEKTKEYINNGMKELKELAKIPQLETMEYSLCTDILKKEIKTHGYFELIALMQKGGLRKAITLDYTEEQVYVNFAHRPYFKEAIEGKEFMSEPYISVDTNNYCIAMSVPIKDKEGNILGILMADLVL